MNYKSLPDEMLLLYLRTGDEKAFREIYLRYWRKLYAMARQKIQDVEGLEEIIQDIFLRLWERRGTLQIQQLDAYLFTAVRYACINHLKSIMTQEKYVAYATYHSTEFCCDTEEQLELDDLINAVEQQLNTLPEKTKTIFKMNRLEYKTVKEISCKLKIPERTIEYHLSQAIKSLRVYLQDYLLLTVLFSYFS
ncbi:RNA polymerase sigma-70 factor [Runella zeae]|uniref:RNA polymerase sigma-70 factor n=1 Tax=Runella zeae TaxID=94255 RepID=UPI000418725B|nr:RNA polymerase sigma-70 factor [Runella zeae]